jgi:hypothetical protein
MQFWGTYRGFAEQGPLTSQLKQTFYYPGTRAQTPDPAQARASYVIDYSRILEDEPLGSQ